MVSDLRDWIKTLETNNLLNRVSRNTDVRDCPKLIYENYNQATLFERIEDYDFPLIANSFSSRQMMSLCLGTDTKDILSEYRSRISKPIPPIFDESGSRRCQEVSIASNESEVDLTKLPILLQHEKDGAPYVSAGVLVAKDPETSEYNIGIYRLMFRQKNELGINITAPHKLRWFYQKAFERGKSLEVAVCLGLHALDCLAAVTSCPEGYDELSVWGGLQKQPIKMVKCKTLDLSVPAHSEIILESKMDPIGWSEPEGMYGEFPGTYSGMRKNPVLKVQAITSRQNPIYQSATHGTDRLANTDFFVLIPQIELSIQTVLENAGIEVKQVRIIPESAGMMCYASIHPRAKGDSRSAVYLVLSGSRQNFPKYCIIVDSDIDVFDDGAVMWALSTRSQPEEDTIILDGIRIPSSSDPSLTGSPPFTMSKLGIDATTPFGADKERFMHSRPPVFAPHVHSDKSGTPDSGLVSGIEKKILTKGPMFFYDVVKLFPDESFRQILLAWSELRENDRIEQGMDGRYAIRNREPSLSK
ncbi:MAG TPA: UbiD family decarboxylase [Nitrososphaerales archaeon]|nr:UbiD family decarboxylase [Nitrososphaerales archaeon]